ncbi:MAG TPA: efflux RND transporter periplasmic adaptor subunit [Bacteroidia bacterium]|nr:efflux RND transporter periplasmic adaptor subunit [Bacteroidia bacterium]
MKDKCRFADRLPFSQRSLALMCGLGSQLFFSCDGWDAGETAADTTVKYIYYCPMHPDVEQDEPGICPKPECQGMALILKDTGDYLAAVLRPVSSSVLSKISLVNPVFKSQNVYAEATGYVDYDNYSKYNVSSRFPGRIEKLFVKYNYQSIKKGEVLFEIYSPDLVTAQENLLYAIKNSPDDSALIKASRQKLKLLQLTDEQINRIETSGKASYSLPVFSEYDGHIHERLDEETGMQNMQVSQLTPLISVREGMYVEGGQIIFNVVDPRRAVGILQVKSSDIAKVSMGQRVGYSINNETKIKEGRVDFIQPAFGDAEKTLTVRVNIDNRDQSVKVGSLLHAKIYSDSLETLWIPASAVVDLGQQRIVWVWKDGYFKARPIETGIRSGTMIEVAGGLSEVEQVASEAHFLFDSEDFINTNGDE